MSYEVPSEEREQRLLRKEIAEQRELMRFTPQPLGNDTSAIGAGSHDNASGVMTTNLTLNPEIMYESVQISWTAGSGGDFQIGHVFKTNIDPIVSNRGTGWRGILLHIVSGDSTAGTGVFEPIWLDPNPTYNPRPEFDNASTTLINETVSGWTASYTNNSKDMGNLVAYSPSLIVDKMEGGNPDINVMHGAKSDGVFTTIRPKEGKTLTISTGGNIDITSNVTVLDNEIAIMQYHEDAGNKWLLLSVGDSGSMIKDAVKVATTTNVTNLIFPSTIDGISMNAGDRFLVKDQTNTVKNGIYIWVNGSASTRASDMSNGSIQKEGTMTYVQDGNTQAEKLYAINTGGNNITIDSTAFTWGEIGGNTWVGTATSDLDMSTYDILNVDRLKFDTTGSAVLTNTTAGINATADEMHFNVPDNDDFKFTIYDNTRFLITDTSTHVYTENGGITFERLRIDNTDAWFYGIALTPTTNTQLIGGSGSNEQWSNVYGNKLSILNNSSNVTTTTQGAVFTNATNGLTLKSPDLGGTNFGSATFTDKDGANRIEFNYDMSSLSGNAVFNYMRNGFKIRTNNSDTEALLVYPRQNSFATNDVIIDAVDSSANGAISIKLNSFERIRLDMTNTTIKAQTSSGEVRVDSKIVMNGSTDAEKEISAGNVVPRSYGYTLGASGSGLLEKGWGALYLTTSGSNADRGKITLNDYGNTYIQLANTGYGLKLISNDDLQMSSVGNTLITAGTGNTITFWAGATATHVFQNNALSLGSGIDLAVNANLIDFANRTTPSSSLFNDGAMYSKDVNGTTTPMWWDGTTETSMLGGGGGSSGGAQFIQEANFQTNHTNYSMWHIVNMHMWSDAGIGSMTAATPNIVTRYMYPIYLSETKTLKNVSTYDAVAGSYRVTWGLYNNATNGELYPTTRIWTSSSNFLNFSGHSTVVGSVNQSLTAGIYWICFQFVSGTGTTIYHGNSDWHNLIGWVEDDSPSSTGGVVGWKEANPSSSMPTTMTSITDSNVSPIKGSDGLIPIIWYRW